MSKDEAASSSSSTDKDSSKIESAKWRSAFPSFVSGAIAGAVAKTTIAPLDRTKINFQVSHTRRYSFKAALKFIKLTYINTGFVSLFRGNSATMARVVPFSAIQFAAYEEYKNLLRVDMDGNKTPVRRFLVGSLASITATSITYPLDAAKARLSVSSKKEYRNLFDVFTNEYKKTGLRIFYRGLYPTLLGGILYAGSTFFTYVSLKILYEEETGSEPNAIFKLLFGGFAGLVGQSISYPLDIVRRRMQTDRITPGEGVFKALHSIATNEGVIRGLYKGLSMNWVKGPVSVGISFTVYEHMFVHLKKLAQAV